MQHVSAASLVRDLVAAVARDPVSAPHHCVPRRARDDEPKMVAARINHRDSASSREVTGHSEARKIFTAGPRRRFDIFRPRRRTLSHFVFFH